MKQGGKENIKAVMECRMSIFFFFCFWSQNRKQKKKKSKEDQGPHVKVRSLYETVKLISYFCVDHMLICWTL